MARRRFLAQMAAWPLAALVPTTTFPEPRTASLKIVLKSAWGSDDPTKAAFPFSHAHALSGGRPRGADLPAGEAVGLMRRSVAEAVVPVGWPPVGELLGKVAARRIPIYACGTCARARGVAEAPRQLGRQVRQPQDLRLAGGVGRSRHHRVARPTHGDERKSPRMTRHGPSPETLTEDLDPLQHRRRYAMGHA